MRIGIVGLGDIAQKAYLPVLALRRDVELILCTRNEETLKQLQKLYKVKEATTSVDELIAMKPDAIYVTVATSAHYAIAKKIIDAKIALHLDKPISFNRSEIDELSELAKKNNTIFMIGFNRRFVPLVKEVHDLGIPDLVIYQKNRQLGSDVPRRMIVEDFVHVIDTTRYLLQKEVKEVRIQTKMKEDQVALILVHLITDSNSAICITNYSNGCQEEVIEVMHPFRKTTIKNLAAIEWFVDNELHTRLPNDWMPMLKKRGFEDLIDAFIEGLKNNIQVISIDDAYASHKIVDEIAQYIEKTL